MIQPLKNKPLRSYQEADARLNIWEGSVSSSKTVTTFFAWVDFVINGPPGELVMVGKTERTLKRNIIDPLIVMYGARNINSTGMGKGEIHIFGRRVYLVGANDERAEQKIRGASFVGAYCDEITLYPESFWIMLLSRLRSSGARLYGTTNPDGPYHWLKVNYLDKGLAHLKKWHFTLDDNPYLDPAYVAALKQEYTGLWYRRFILGEWCLAEGSVYDMWDESAHVIDEIPVGNKDYVIGVDYGTNNPCVFLLIGIHRDKIIVEKEYYYDSTEKGRQKTDLQYAKDLKEFIGRIEPEALIVDPSAASFKVQLSEEGLSTTDADNSVIDGIRYVSSLLVSGKLVVSKNCPNLIKEFSSYVWDQKRQAKGEDVPVKQHDHCLIAGTLVTTDEGDIPIEHITPQYKIYTRDGYFPIKWAGMTNTAAEIYEVKLSNGNMILGTANHPIFIEGKGFIPLDTIRYGDKCICLSLLSLTGSPSEDIPIRGDDLTGFISNAIPDFSKRVSGTSIRKYGKPHMGISQKGTSFTIRTETPLTTPSKTSSASLIQNTRATTQKIGIVKTPDMSNHTSTPSDHSQKNGTLRKGVLNGTANTASKLSKPGNPLNESVKFAEKSSTISLSGTAPVSARINVNQNGGEIQDSTISLNSVSSAGKILPQINMQKIDFALNHVHVISITKTNLIKPVFNLQVDGPPEFFANGILVHNCLDALRYALYTYQPDFGEGPQLISGGFGKAQREENRRRL